MKNSKDERVISLLDSFLEGREEISNAQELGVVPMDYVSAYLNTPSEDKVSAADNVIRSKSEQLLDAFLATDYKRPSFTQVEGENVDLAESEDETEQLDESYFTETLARIYLKQRRYEKALEIIQSLYLNFPNKSIYFADQIRFLEKLVRINQKIE